jgi:hypothetical protein
MPQLVITHGVVDVDTWLQFKSERADSIAAMGGTNAVDYVAYDGSNAVAVAADVDDVAGMMAGLASPPPEIAAVMEKHGVLPPLVAYIQK